LAHFVIYCFQLLLKSKLRRYNKALYASSSAPGGAANADAAALSLANAASKSLMALPDAAGADTSQLTAMHAELQAELAKHKEAGAYTRPLFSST